MDGQILKPKKYSFVSDMWDFMKVRRKWWLLPIVIMLFIVGAVIIIGQSSVISPFIYALF